jgi:hypothetical protein
MIRGKKHLLPVVAEIILLNKLILVSNHCLIITSLIFILIDILGITATRTGDIKKKRPNHRTD